PPWRRAGQGRVGAGYSCRTGSPWLVVPVASSLLQHSALGYRCGMHSSRALQRRLRTLALLFIAISSSAAVQAAWITREAAIMGTRCAVELWSEDAKAGEAAIEAVLSDMRRIDALMSTYKETSEISRVNAEAAQHPVAVSAELFALLQTSLE